MSLGMKQYKLVLLSLEKQGCALKETKKGWLIRFPNGDTACFHKTPSDHRSAMNMRSYVKRAGLHWPLDGKQT